MTKPTPRNRGRDIDDLWDSKTGAKGDAKKQNDMRRRVLRADDFIPRAWSFYNDADVARYVVAMLVGETHKTAAATAEKLYDAVPVWTNTPPSTAYQRWTFGEMLTVACQGIRAEGKLIIDRIEVDTAGKSANLHFLREDDQKWATAYAWIAPGTPVPSPVDKTFHTLADVLKPREGIYPVETLRVLQGEVIAYLAAPVGDARDSNPITDAES